MRRQTTAEDRVRSLLAAAAAPTEPGELPGEAEALAAFRAASRPDTRRTPMRSTLGLKKLAAAATAGTGLILAGGVTAAAAGALPDAAQDTARDMLAKVGVQVPGGEGATAPAAEPDGGEDHGQEVSELATTTDSEGREKGQEISELASDGKARGGEDLAEPEDTTTEDVPGKGAEVSELATTTESEGRDKGAEVSELASEGRSHASEKAGGASTDGKARARGERKDHGAAGADNRR